MTYKLEFYPKVEKQLIKINKPERKKIFEKILLLKRNPFPKNSRKLIHSNGYYRLRIGNYRAVYRVDDKIYLISVVSVKHRSDVYKNL